MRAGGRWTSSSRARGSSRLGSSRRSFVTSSTAGLRARRSTRTRSSALVAVRDRRPAVAPEGLRAQLHSGRRLAALVLGAIDEGDRALDHSRVELLGELLARAVLL